MNVEAMVAILAALGGGGFLLQMFGLWKSYREGAKLKADEADERLIKRYEDRVSRLEMRADADARYIARLVSALGRAGIEIPDRADE